MNTDKSMTQQYLKMLRGSHFKFEQTGKTAFLYCGGPAIHHSDAKNFKCSKDGVVVVKTQMGYTSYSVAKYITKLGVDLSYVSMDSNTCASSMYALHEAQKLLDSGFDDVIIYAEEMAEDTVRLLFEQIGVDIVCSSGMAIMHVSSHGSKQSVEITDTSWTWNMDLSPMTVSSDGYYKMLCGLGDLSDVKYVKTHGTGTKTNDIAENSAIETVFKDIEIVNYKNKIGHTQGASALIELCMLIDSGRKGKAVCMASGIGSLYGGIKIIL